MFAFAFFLFSFRSFGVFAFFLRASGFRVEVRAQFSEVAFCFVGFSFRRSFLRRGSATTRESPRDDHEHRQQSTTLHWRDCTRC